MPKDMRFINVVDVESTCWEPKESRPSDQESEIIEIGITVLQTKPLGIVKSNSVYVFPQYSTISPFCEKLTGITSELVRENGLKLYNALQWITSALEPKNRIWASYGDYDRTQIQKDCKRKGVDYPFGSRHINIKTLFAIMMGLDKEVGMDTALEMLGIPLEGRHHSGLDDSKNIAKILERMIQCLRTGDL